MTGDAINEIIEKNQLVFSLLNQIKSKLISDNKLWYNAIKQRDQFRNFPIDYFFCLISYSNSYLSFSISQFVSAGASVISQHVNRNISNPAEIVNVKQGMKSIEVSWYFLKSILFLFLSRIISKHASRTYVSTRKRLSCWGRRYHSWITIFRH